MRGCAAEREVRRRAFRRCDPIRRAIEVLWEAAAASDLEVEDVDGGEVEAADKEAAGASRGARGRGAGAAGARPSDGMARTAFLNLHLSLAHAGYFRPPHATLLYPQYCYFPPPYCRYIATRPPPERQPQPAHGGQSALPSAPELEDYAEEEGDEDDEPGRGFAPYMEGIAAFRLLLDTLPPESLQCLPPEV